MTGFVLLLVILLKYSDGALDITFSINPATVGDSVIITCTKSPTLAASVSWFNDRYATNVISFCLHTTDTCTPSTKDDIYLFSSDIANRKFTMTITTVEQADAGVYTCKDSSPDEGEATLQVQTGTAKDGGWTKDRKTQFVGVVAGLAVVAVLAVLVVVIVVLYFTGRLPGSWSKSVPIPQDYNPIIKFEEVMDDKFLNQLEAETGANIFICGKGSDKYEKREGQDDKSLPGEDQPLQVYVTARFNIKVKRAGKKIKAIIRDAIAKKVPIPQDDNPKIRFEEVLNDDTLNKVEKKKGVKIKITGKGASKFGKHAEPQLHPDEQLQACITLTNVTEIVTKTIIKWEVSSIHDEKGQPQRHSDKPSQASITYEKVTETVTKIEEIIQKAISEE